MANPSLQIGNSNWAIKEDNLLGYSTAGTRFVPQPITMTRASAGTRVNSSGLVETVELLGSEEVTNWDMELDCCWANYASGTTTNERSTEQVYGSNYSRKYATTTATTGGIQSDNFTTSTGGTYNVSFWVYPATGTSQRIAVRKGDNSGWAVDSTFSGLTQNSWNNCTITYTETVGGSTAFIAFHSNGVVGTWYIDNVSVKESTKNNLARVDYDGTASSLLVEPERKNDFTQSNDFANAYWSKNSTAIDTSIGTDGIQSNISTSPDGTINADRVNFLLQSDKDIGLARSLDSSVGITHSCSVWLKGEETNIGKDVIIRVKRSYGGSYVAVNKTVTLTSIWQRVEIEPLTLVTDNAGVRAILSSNDATNCLIYGFQSEVGSYPTSYIPTDGSTVTRVQDQYSKTGISNLINSEEGVLFVEMAALDSDGTYRYVLLNDGTTANTVQIRYSNVSNNIQALVYNSSVLQAFTSYTPTDTTSFHKIAFKYKENDFALWVDGTKVGTDTSGTTALPLSSLVFSNFFGKVKQLQVFKTALTDPELAALTS